MAHDAAHDAGLFEHGTGNSEPCTSYLALGKSHCFSQSWICLSFLNYKLFASLLFCFRVTDLLLRILYSNLSSWMNFRMFNSQRSNHF